MNAAADQARIPDWLVAPAGAAVRLSEIIAALSYALDLTEGQPPGHCLRVCWIGMHVGQALGFDSVDRDFERHIFKLLLRLGDFGVDAGSDNFAAHVRPRGEGGIEPDAEPGTELFGVREGAPDSFERCAKKDLFLDTVGTHVQPTG